MTIVPFLMVWGLVFAILILIALAIAIALHNPSKQNGTQTKMEPLPMQAQLHIVPVKPITDQVLELKNVICNVRFPINR